MKKQILSNILIATVFGTAAFSVSAQNLATVNGKPIPQQRVTDLKKQIEQSGTKVTPDLEKKLKDEVIMREIFMQEAINRGLDSTADFKANLQNAKESLLIRELLNDFQKKNPINAAEVKATYDKVVAENSGQEYQASHILVDSEDRAKAIIAEIKSGKKKFEDIAKEESKDSGSAAKGGSLGWADPGAYVPEFSDAMKQLKKGSLTEKPVKSQFGWHVIRLDGTRDAQFPKLEEVKGQIEQQLTQEKLLKFQDELRSKAKIVE